jgi:hypothetical protein
MCSKAGVSARNGNDIAKTPDESRAAAELSAGAGGRQDW